MPKNKKLALNSRIQTYQIMKNDDDVCIPCLFSILLAVHMHSDLDCRIVSKKDFQTSFLGQEFLIA